jgi:hypothetical protein
VVLFLAFLIAAKTFLGKKGLTKIPNDATTIIQQLMIILIVHSWAIAQALKLRTRLMTREEYFSEAGTGDALANIKIFAKCWMVSLLLYLLLYGPNLVSVLGPPDPAQNPGSNPQSSAELLWGLYVYPWIVWSIVPACCGVMTAFTLDRASTTRVEQATSGMLEGAVMAGAALLVLELTQIASPEYRTASTEYRVYYFVLYGGLGFVLGFLLPAAIRRFWSARETRLPDKISVLRTAVLQYFHDIQQFSEWLHARNARLDGKRPLDILTEESGLQRLTSFVTETRSRISPVAA